MRLGVAAFAVTLLASSAASASSFVTFGTSEKIATPSIISLGALPAKAPSAAASAIDPSSELAGLPELDPLHAFGSDVGPRFEDVSPSIVAVISPLPPVSSEMVAAIEKPKPRPHDLAMPMVIRGGIVGEAFASADAEPAAAAPPPPEPPASPARQDAIAQGQAAKSEPEPEPPAPPLQKAVPQ